MVKITVLSYRNFPPRRVNMETEKKKVLLVTTVSGFVPQFEMNNVRILQSMGYEVHYASNYHMPVYTDNNDRLNGTGIIQHQIDFVRSPFSMKNLRAYKQLKNLMKEIPFELVHCHTPMGGVLARLAANRVGISHVIYTAHGFHFFQGASWKNWLCFYPVERALAKYTDVLITINQEDYEQAKSFKLRDEGTVVLIQGVGIDTNRQCVTKDDALREKLGLTKKQIVFTSVGELTKRKNHEVVIRAMAETVKKRQDISYLICGSGVLEEYLRNLISELNLEQNVKLLGYCTNVMDILQITDCFVFPSKQEGLPVAVLEAMNAQLPVICSKIRGNIDLIEEKKGGFLIANNSIEEYAKKMLVLAEKTELRKQFGSYNKEHVRRYDQTVVSEHMKLVYSEELGLPMC